MGAEKDLIKHLNKIGINVSSISDLAEKPSTEKDLIEDLKSIGVEVTSVRDLAKGFHSYEKVEPLLRKHYVKSKDIQFKRAIELALESIERGLIEDLKKVGITVSSVWDLVNGPNNYEQAEPILIEHLKKTKECRFKEGIIRALCVKSFKNAIQPLLNEFKNSKDESYKWVVANSLATIVPHEVLDDLIEIMGDNSHGSARQMIAYALGRINDPKSVPVLLKALEDNEVAGHAIIALGKVGNKETINSIEPFTKHKMKWIRNAAKKAIKQIEKRNSKV